jgi:hypothetical protein
MTTIPAERGTDRLRAAPATTFAPCGRRTMWAATYRCPHCGGWHLSRAQTEQEITGRRRAGCGRLVQLITVARA